MTAFVKAAPSRCWRASELLFLAARLHWPAGFGDERRAARTARFRARALDVDARTRRDIGLEPWEITWA
jgi:hypothetical protein